MEINIPVSIVSDAGEVVFNYLEDSSLNPAPSLAGLSNVVAPVNLPDGNGYHLTFIGGNDGAPIRNPVTNKPHTHGTIPHRFRRSGKIIHVEGNIVVSHPQYRKPLGDNLRAVLNACLKAGIFGQASENSGRLLWQLPGADIRFHTVYFYEKLNFTGTQAEPKTFSFSLFSEHPEALTYSQDIGTGGFQPNDGNTRTWPVIKVYASGEFTLSNGTYQLHWGKSFEGDALPILGSYIEIDMFRQTMFWNGNGANALPRLFTTESDFWSIPVGGCSISCGASIEVLSNSAWVG